MLRAALKLPKDSEQFLEHGVAPHIMLRAALKPDLEQHSNKNGAVAPHTMLRAALKRLIVRLTGEPLFSCTTYHAACGIETFLTSCNPLQGCVAPHIMLRAALKPRCPFLLCS